MTDLEVTAIGQPIVIGLGEALWDLLPGGRMLGGAPTNFAYHAHALGADAWPITRVGDDPLGRELVHQLGALGLPTGCVQTDSDAPTGTVSVEMLPDGGHKFTIHEKVAWDRLEAAPEAIEIACRADAICFGSLGQRDPQARSAVQHIAAAVRPAALRIFDVNLRQHYYSREVIERSLKLANVFKLNDEEYPVVADILGVSGDRADFLLSVARRYSLNLVALTRGSNGSVLFSGGRVSDLPGEPIGTVDTIGAGDAFTAAITLGLLAGWELDVLHRRAHDVAAFVCTRPGGTPELPKELTAPFLRVSIL